MACGARSSDSRQTQSIGVSQVWAHPLFDFFDGHALARGVVGYLVLAQLARLEVGAARVAEDERREVESYIDGRLATLEVILNKTMDAVARGRERLEGADDNDVLSQLNSDD